MVTDEFREKHSRTAEWYVTAFQRLEEEKRRASAALWGGLLAVLALLAVRGETDGVAGSVLLVAGLLGGWLYSRWASGKSQSLDEELDFRLGAASEVGSPERGQFFELVDSERKRRGYRTH